MPQTNSPARKAMMAARRAKQLSRIAGFTPSPKRLRLKQPLPAPKTIKRNDGSRIHPTKGMRPITAYEILIRIG